MIVERERKNECYTVASRCARRYLLRGEFPQSIAVYCPLGFDLNKKMLSETSLTSRTNSPLLRLKRPNTCHTDPIK